MPSASSTPSPAARSSAFVGDGGFAMLMAEFLTAIKHKLPVKIVINNNNSLGQILWEQMVLGYPEHGVRYPEPFVDYAAFATANGALGIKVERSKDVHKAIERVLGHDGPALADVNVNPDEPPLPGRSSTSRRRSSPRRSCAASRARQRSPAPSSGTRSSSSGDDFAGDRWVVQAAMGTEREALSEAGENPAAAADAQQHVRQEVAAVEASVARRVRHQLRWLAVSAGALAGWLIARRRPRR